jgi:TRAP-type transport system periplasmic protein
MLNKKHFKQLVTTAFSAQAATRKYAMEEGVTDPQGMYALKFKEEIEKNSKNKIKIYPVGALVNLPMRWNRLRLV